MNIIDIIKSNIILESEAYPFRKKVEPKEYSGIRYNNNLYNFTIDGVDFKCLISPNLWQMGKGHYDVAFIVEGGTTKDRVGKDLNFMNSVLKTVAECIIDFIESTDKVKIISFEGKGVRRPAYVRFFKSHPYFSKFKMSGTNAHGGFVDIHIDKG